MKILKNQEQGKGCKDKGNDRQSYNTQVGTLALDDYMLVFIQQGPIEGQMKNGWVRCICMYSLSNY